MNTCRAAALALVAWYLLVPPSNLIGIPMANWQLVGVFDSKAACESNRLRLADRPSRIVTNPGPAYQPERNPARCASTDDPRIKGNAFVIRR
jgi:hypothetical protein